MAVFEIDEQNKKAAKAIEEVETTLAEANTHDASIVHRVDRGYDRFKMNFPTPLIRELGIQDGNYRAVMKKIDDDMVVMQVVPDG